MAIIQCPECGGKVSDKAPACIHCGYPFKEYQVKKMWFCSGCGRENAFESIFCGYCGKAFVEGVEENNSLPIISSGDHGVDLMDFKNSLDMSNDREMVRSEGEYIYQQRQFEEQQRQYQAQAKCPRCGSTSLSGFKQGFGIGKAVTGVVLFGGLGVLAGGINSNKTIVTCLKCGYKFKL